MFEVNKPMALEGAGNVRELGGYPTADGGRTKAGAFLRSDGTHALTDGDLAALREAGVTLVVDMRSPEEVQRQPSRLKGAAGVRYENVIMFDGTQSSFFRDALPASMAQLYRNLLDGGQVPYERIFRYFLENDGVSLFHCTAGKDRTGVVAMLLLQLAGVPDEVIVADYAASEKNMEGIVFAQMDKLAGQGIEVPAFVFGSKPADMEAALAHLYEQYGDAARYLELCGLDKGEVAALRAKLV